MADAIRTGEIDGFCVGEPWGSLAVEQGVGTLLILGAAIWSFSPEKVLAMRTEWAEAHPEICAPLICAVVNARRWIANPSSQSVAAEVLATPDFLNLSGEFLDRGLSGQVMISRRGTSEMYHRFWNSAAVLRPSLGQAKLNGSAYNWRVALALTVMLRRAPRVAFFAQTSTAQR